MVRATRGNGWMCGISLVVKDLEAIALSASIKRGVAPRGVPDWFNRGMGLHKPIAELQCGCRCRKMSNPDRLRASWALRTGNCFSDGVW